MRHFTGLLLASTLALVGACVEGSGADDGGGGGGFGDPEGKIVLNGLVLDFDAVEALATDPLASDAGTPLLLDEASHGAMLAAPGGEELLSYLVSCALPEGEELQVPSTQMVYEGSLGLAPQWATSSCDGECQRWVSACLLAHTNAMGNSVLISPRGDHPALGFNEALAAQYSYEEAAYYGNLFGGAAQLEAFACTGDGLYGTALGSGDDGLGVGDVFLSGRVCGADTETCGFVHTGLCSDSLLIGVPTGIELSTCARDEFGFFVDCSTTSAEDAGDLGHSGSERYTEVITVYLDA